MTEAKTPTAVFEADTSVGFFNDMNSGIKFYRPDQQPVVTFRPDGIVEVRGDAYESAKAFWDYVKQFAAAEYAKHAATHHEIRDLGEFVAKRKGKE